MSLDQMLRQGSNAWVARKVLAGWTEDQILEGMNSVPDWAAQTDRTRQAALRRGLDALSAAQVFDRNDPRFPLTPGDVPSAGPARRGYRFYVVVKVYDPFDQTTRYFHTNIDTPTLVSQSGLRTEADRRVQEQFTQRTGTPRLLEVIGPPVATVETVIAIERTP